MTMDKRHVVTNFRYEGFQCIKFKHIFYKGELINIFWISKNKCELK